MLYVDINNKFYTLAVVDIDMCNNKKILLVSHLNPFSNSFGAEQRTNLILTSLIKIGYNVDIAYIGEHAVNNKIIHEKCRLIDYSYLNKMISKIALFKRLALINMFPKSEYVSAAIKKLVKENDYSFIFCRYLNYAALADLGRFGDKLILDIDDMPEQALQIDFSNKRGIKKLYFNLLKRAYRKDTLKWIRKTRKCYVPNKNQAMEYNIGYLPNISSIWNDDLVNDEVNNNILFVGKLDWEPNRQGVMHFLECCWNELKMKIPSVRLFIGGKGIDEKSMRDLEREFPGVQFLGFINDLKEFYRLGSIVICPIYSGAGTNIKIVEALSMRKTLVVTKESIKGYEDFLSNNINCLIAENDRQFVDKIIFALEHVDMSRAISSNGFHDVSSEYSFESIKTIISTELCL